MKTIYTTAGGILSATLASSCCVLPFIAGFLGISSGGLAIFNGLEKYRILFGIFVLLFLAASFYLTYRKAPCGSDGSCSVENPLLKRINKIMLWVGTPIMIGLFFFPSIFQFFL